MNKKEDLVDYDFQGWPVFKMNLKEILLGLGGKILDKSITFDLNDPTLESYPRVLTDDGMAYGVDESYITEASIVKGDKEVFINIFRIPVPSDARKVKLLRRWESEEKAAEEIKKKCNK